MSQPFRYTVRYEGLHQRPPFKLGSVGICASPFVCVVHCTEDILRFVHEDVAQVSLGRYGPIIKCDGVSGFQVGGNEPVADGCAVEGDSACADVGEGLFARADAGGDEEEVEGLGGF